MPTYLIGLTVLMTRQCGEDYLIGDEESLIFIDSDSTTAREFKIEYGDPVKYI